MDFSNITNQSQLYNFHTHTQFCDGHAPMEAFVCEALKRGFTHLGFSPHSPLPFETSCNMSRANVAEYISEIERLRHLYGSRIHIFAAMEIDYIDTFGPSDAFYDTIPLDYRIGSIHFIPSFTNPQEYVDIDGHIDSFIKKMREFFDDDIEKVVRSFYAQSLKMVEKGGFDVIGHFDKIGLNASLFKPGIDEEPWYDRLFMDLFEAIMDHHLVVEINTKAWMKHHRFFPSIKYFSLLKRYGTPILINSDAHEPTLINTGRHAAIEYLNCI
ncbi:MAG: histidinol-phosphatase [Muribaculaceae bacterium]|nr:histidinol-phosphatase [Muribaculaceae bacterium]